MKISINQPYFFPYIGYYQLINASDVFVNLNHVSFMKRSYMTRNVLKNNTQINIPVMGASQNKKCYEVHVIDDYVWIDKFSKTLDQLYGKEENYDEILGKVLVPWFDSLEEGSSISEFNMNSIYIICRYLNIQTNFRFSSRGLTENKREKGLQDIVKYYKGDTYINAIGGQKLYNKENFAEQGIDLKFIKNNSQLPNTSILDLLFRYDKEVIKQELNNYELI